MNGMEKEGRTRILGLDGTIDNGTSGKCPHNRWLTGNGSSSMSALSTKYLLWSSTSWFLIFLKDFSDFS